MQVLSTEFLVHTVYVVHYRIVSIFVTIRMVCIALHRMMMIWLYELHILLFDIVRGARKAAHIKDRVLININKMIRMA